MCNTYSFRNNQATNQNWIVSSEEWPLWHFYNNNTNHCQHYQCHGNLLGKDIHCNDDGILLIVGNCMIYLGTFFAGCYYFQLPYGNIIANGYCQLPSNVSKMNDFMRGHQKGIVCSECVDGFGPSVMPFGYSVQTAQNH